jgi:hypothetical protein
MGTAVQIRWSERLAKHEREDLCRNSAPSRCRAGRRPAPVPRNARPGRPRWASGGPGLRPTWSLARRRGTRSRPVQAGAGGCHLALSADPAGRAAGTRALCPPSSLGPLRTSGPCSSRPQVLPQRGRPPRPTCPSRRRPHRHRRGPPRTRAPHGARMQGISSPGAARWYRCSHRQAQRTPGTDRCECGRLHALSSWLRRAVAIERCWPAGRRRARRFHPGPGFGCVAPLSVSVRHRGPRARVPESGSCRPLTRPWPCL